MQTLFIQYWFLPMFIFLILTGFFGPPFDPKGFVLKMSDACTSIVAMLDYLIVMFFLCNILRETSVPSAPVRRTPCTAGSPWREVTSTIGVASGRKCKKKAKGKARGKSKGKLKGR